MPLISSIKKSFRHFLISVRNYDPRDIALWQSDEEIREGLDSDKPCIHYSALDVEFDYLIRSPMFVLSAGLYEISLRGEITEGACSFGVLNVKNDSWITTQQIRALDGRARVLVPILKKELLQLVISANNTNGSASVTATLSKVKVEKKGDRSVAESMITQRAEQEDISRWRREVQPQQLLENLEAEIAHSEPRPAGSYGIVEATEIGYAARSIASFVKDKALYILVANAGDDTVTVLERELPSEPLKRKCDFQFPKFSTPIDVQTIQTENDGILGISFFHMQEVVSSFGMTGFGAISTNLVLERAAISDVVEIDKSEIQFLHSRDHFRGARNSAVVGKEGGHRWLAVADRDASAIWFFYQAPEDETWRTPAYVMQLSAGFEPVGITGIMRGEKAVFYASARLLPQIATIVIAAEEDPEITAITDVGGLSRSSIAIGLFNNDKKLGLAVGLWGGDPRKITIPYQGSVFYADISDSGSLINHLWFEAGVNTTDVIAGDLDGDGMDELVVLNYGNGLNLEERSHLGDMQIFKKTTDNFECVATIDIPSPRIGLIADFDGDGRQELGVTLFHENRFVVIKHFT